MQTLQHALDQFVEKLPEQLIEELVRRKLSNQAITLSRRDVRRLVTHILRGEPEMLRVRRWRWWERDELVLDFSDAEVEALKRCFDQDLIDCLPEIIKNLTAELVPQILATLKRQWRRESWLQRWKSSGFRRRLHQRWRVPLGQLRMLLTIAKDYGASLDEELRGFEQLDSPQLIDVLMRLQARACQVTEEIIVLLTAGFADAAMARWRTLHEISVTSQFIENHGEEIAKRYVMHEVVESRQAALNYKRCQERLGYEPMTDDQFSEIENAYSTVVDQFGRSFGSSYGWAAQHLGKERPTFADIEQAVGIGHLRAHYQMASHSVHANPKGVFFQLGLLEDTEFLLAGPSNAGLAEPGHVTAISLVQVNAALGNLRPTLDYIVVLKIMLQIEREIGEACEEVAEQLERDSA